MARLSTEKFEPLQKAFAEQAMTPGQAAPAVGVTYVTAKRWYEKWGDDIKRSLESRLLPTLKESVKRQANPAGRYSTICCSDEAIRTFGFNLLWQDSEELRELPLIGRDARLLQACMLHACLFTQDHWLKYCREQSGA